MKNELLKEQIRKLVKEREDLTYDLRQVGFNDMSWVTQEINYTNRVSAIEMRIDNLMMQITE